MEPSYVITTTGVKVYRRWQDNIIVDADLPPIRWKAAKDRFTSITDVPGWPRIASQNSEDALSWNVFRSLEKAGRLDVVANLMGLEDTFQVLYWYRPCDADGPTPEIVAALKQTEPWGQIRGRYQTETDIILKGQHYLVMVEAKLGKPGAHLRAWQRGGPGPVPQTYRPLMEPLLVNMSRWEETMYRFYQLLRHLILAAELCKPGGWPLEPYLMAVVNALNVNRHGMSHEREFAEFQRQLRLPASQTHLVTWQNLTQAIALAQEPDLLP
jgi:hypothetical protein